MLVEKIAPEEKCSVTPANNDWAFGDQAAPWVGELLGAVPGRWGRMTPLSRLLLVRTAEYLREQDLWPATRFLDQGMRVGLIGATRRGSLATDLQFIDTMRRGAGMASPALFGYTLPNIPLAEVASQFGLTGPVYALFEQEDCLACARREAESLLSEDPTLSFMIACSFDQIPDQGSADGSSDTLIATLTLIRRNAESNSDIS